MDPETMCKKWLKPPFSVVRGIIFDGEKSIGMLNMPVNMTGDFFAAALNEKWERDFGEPMRWLIKGDGFNVDSYLVCPKCDEEPGLFWDGEGCDNLPNYCPRCGRRLDPPEVNDRRDE
jgi:hypothetical protein